MTLVYFNSMVTVPHKMVKLERMSDYRDVGVERSPYNMYTVRPHLSAHQISSLLIFRSSFCRNKSSIILLYTILLLLRLSSSLTLSAISSRMDVYAVMGGLTVYVRMYVCTHVYVCTLYCTCTSLPVERDINCRLHISRAIVAACYHLLALHVFS